MNSLVYASWWSGLALAGAGWSGAACAASHEAVPVSDDDLLGLEDEAGQVEEVEEAEDLTGEAVESADLWLLAPSVGEDAAGVLASREQATGMDLGDLLTGRLPSRGQAAAARWVPQVSVEVRAAWGSAAGARQAQDGAITGWLTATWVPAASRSTSQAAAWERQGLWMVDVEDASGLRLASLSRTHQVAGIVSSLSRRRAARAGPTLSGAATVAEHVHQALAVAEWEALHPVAAQAPRGGR